MNDELWPKIVLDPTVPEGEIHARDNSGKTLAKIYNIAPSSYVLPPVPGFNPLDQIMMKAMKQVHEQTEARLKEMQEAGLDLNDYEVRGSYQIEGMKFSYQVEIKLR